jgi:hypothetical protein
MMCSKDIDIDKSYKDKDGCMKEDGEEEEDAWIDM